MKMKKKFIIFIILGEIENKKVEFKIFVGKKKKETNLRVTHIFFCPNRDGVHSPVDLGSFARVISGI